MCVASERRVSGPDTGMWWGSTARCKVWEFEGLLREESHEDTL